MKFWKPTLLTTLLFAAFIGTFLYTSCSQDVCNNVVCYNGGSCSSGTCLCPTGYMGTQCQTESVSIFTGAYGGYTICNNQQEVIDTVTIHADTSSPAMINYVWVSWKSILPTILHGYVSYNASTYSIIVPEVTAANYQKNYTITLQSNAGSNNSLSVHSYEYSTVTAGDTVDNECAFLGVKD